VNYLTLLVSDIASTERQSTVMAGYAVTAAITYRFIFKRA